MQHNSTKCQQNTNKAVCPRLDHHHLSTISLAFTPAGVHNFSPVVVDPAAPAASMVTKLRNKRRLTTTIFFPDRLMTTMFPSNRKFLSRLQSVTGKNPTNLAHLVLCPPHLSCYQQKMQLAPFQALRRS